MTNVVVSRVVRCDNCGKEVDVPEPDRTYQPPGWITERLSLVISNGYGDFCSAECLIVKWTGGIEQEARKVFAQRVTA